MCVMKRVVCITVAALALVACRGSGKSEETTAAASTPPPAAKGAPLFNNLGAYTRSVTTTSDQARRYFSQGMLLTFGFNHAEAGRSFREAARLDPQCAACWWGAALVMGPNINLPMSDDDVAEAYSAAHKAVSLLDNETPVERALAEALTKRYAEKPVPDRSSLDRAYADAMR